MVDTGCLMVDKGGTGLGIAQVYAGNFVFLGANYTYSFGQIGKPSNFQQNKIVLNFLNVRWFFVAKVHIKNISVFVIRMSEI